MDATKRQVCALEVIDGDADAHLMPSLPVWSMGGAPSLASMPRCHRRATAPAGVGLVAPMRFAWHHLLIHSPRCR